MGHWTRVARASAESEGGSLEIKNIRLGDQHGSARMNGEGTCVPAGQVDYHRFDLRRWRWQQPSFTLQRQGLLETHRPKSASTTSSPHKHVCSAGCAMNESGETTTLQTHK